MRIYMPIEVIFDNPYQSPYRDYADIEQFATQEIAPFYETRPETGGLQQVPQVRLMLEVDSLAMLTDRDLEQLLITVPPLTATKDTPWVKELHRRWQESGYFAQCIFGHRRRRAIAHLAEHDERYSHGLIAVEVIQLDNHHLLREVFAENTFRKNTTAVEDSYLVQQAFYQLEQLHGRPATQKEVADYLQLSRSRVANLMRLADLPDEIKEANLDGRISGAHCEELLAVIRLAGVVGRKDSPSYLTAPNDYIEKTLTESGSVSRWHIREYVKNYTRNTGVGLDSELLKMEIDVEGVRQSRCSTCPANFDNICVDLSCLAIKQKQAVKKLAKKKYPHVEWSETRGHFKPFEDYRSSREFLDYIKRLEKLSDDPDIVLGFANEGYGARILHDGYWTHKNEDISALLVAGYKGEQLPELPGAPDEAEEEREEREERNRQERHDAYELFARRKLKDIQRHIAGAVEEALDKAVLESTRSFLALVFNSMKELYGEAYQPWEQIVSTVAKTVPSDGWDKWETWKRNLHMAAQLGAPYSVGVEEEIKLILGAVANRYWDVSGLVRHIRDDVSIETLIDEGRRAGVDPVVLQDLERVFSLPAEEEETFELMNEIKTSEVEK